ncbi:MAG TPA: sugar phosphate isomerase/epimerase [Terriglobales bacterium]|nr:sugar phosphate isomerase/epimerase [Terriglobales bacterium]
MGRALERREFLRVGALGALALGVPSSIAFAAPKPQKFKIGMAATTWLTETASTDSYWNAAQAIAALNIGATEADNGEARLDSAYHNNVSAFRKRSHAVGVRLPGVFQALPLHDSQKLPEMQSKVRSVAGFLQTAGAEYIALGWDVPSSAPGKLYQRTPEDVRNAISVMDNIGRLALEDFGIVIAFHAERDIPKQIVLQVLDQTNPKYIRFCADVGHLTGMGLNAVETVKTYASKLAVSHWKDFDPKLPGPSYLGESGTGDFVELGKGVVNFPALADLYRDIGFNGWVMLELDRTREPSIEASAQEMKAYVTDRLKLRMYPRKAK